MFKKIPGSSEYRINLEEIIIDCYGKTIDLKSNSRKTIDIELFGEKKSLTKTKLKFLAWYEVSHIQNLPEHLDKIKFYRVENNIFRIQCGVLMTFSDPIYYKDGFRYIPSFPRYAINIDGEVLDTLTNLICTNRKKDTTGYERVYIYSPDQNSNRFIAIHRLLCLAWLPNSDFLLRPYINHIDGDKTNNKLENLEWCSLVENSQHAFRTGLVGSAVKIKTRDRFTGEVTVYNTVSEMSKKLGMTSISATNFINKLPGYLYRKRYEIKLFDDNSQWYYEDPDCVPDEPSKAIFTITTINKKTGEIRKFNNVRIFYKTYKIWVSSCRLDDAVVCFQQKYPYMEISYKRNSVVGPYRVFDIETKETVIFNSIWESARYMGRTRTEIQYDLSRELKFIYSNKWAIIPGPNCDDIKLEDYRNKPKPFKKVAVIREDGSETIVNSMKHASRVSKIDYKSVFKYINTGKFFKGFKFRALE